MDLLWKPEAESWKPPIVPDEHEGWAAEQRAWRADVAISDLSYHMSDTFLRGSQVTELLSAVSANDCTSFEIGRAKQFVPVAADGNLITDGILLRDGEESFVLSGVPAAQNWVAHYAAAGGYDVECTTDPDRSFTPGDPRLFRLQVQGPAALEFVERAFGGPLPAMKFFRSTLVTLDGAEIRALRHGMAGQAGYEFIGPYRHHDHVLSTLLRAGEGLGVTQVGALAYATNGVESGWIPNPTPAIYTDDSLADYRDAVGLYSYEGQNPLYGSFYSPRIEDYYTSPWELGYGRSISLDHDFIGRDALRATKDQVTRTKVTLEIAPSEALPAEGEYLNDYGRHSVEVGGELVGLTFQTARIGPVGRVLALALVDHAHAEPGTRVEVVFGRHPGGDTSPEADLRFPRLAATVRPAPYNDYARTAYRAD